MKEAKSKILYLDDERINLQVFKAGYRPHYEVFTTDNVDEAFNILKDNPISVLISDQRMPVMNGDEFLRKSRTISEDSVRFLLTGYTDLDAVVSAVNNGNISKYIHKPWNNQDLKIDIDNAIQLFDSRQQNRKLLAELEEHNKNLESKVKERTQELEIANKTKEKFLGIIGHDLRGPIGTYATLAEFVESSIDEIDNKQLKDVISSMKNSANYIFALLNDLVNWSKTQQDIIKPVVELFKADVLTKDAIIPLKSIAEVKKIQVSIDSKIDDIWTDKNLFLTIIRNILNNAIKFTPKDGKIKIELSKENEIVCIKIIDNGKGMSQDLIDKLNSVNDLNSENFTTSNGLGLLLCKDFLDQLNGSMKFEINELNGITVNIKLPQ